MGLRVKIFVSFILCFSASGPYYVPYVIMYISSFFNFSVFLLPYTSSLSGLYRQSQAISYEVCVSLILLRFFLYLIKIVFNFFLWSLRIGLMSVICLKF